MAEPDLHTKRKVKRGPVPEVRSLAEGLRGGAVIDEEGRSFHYVVHIDAGSTSRTYSLRRVPPWPHWLAADLLKWRVAIIDVAAFRRRVVMREREAIRADWENRP